MTIPESEMLVLEGTSVTILCEVNGIPQSRVTWSKDGRNISPGRQYEINVRDWNITSLEKNCFSIELKLFLNLIFIQFCTNR